MSGFLTAFIYLLEYLYCYSMLYKLLWIFPSVQGEGNTNKEGEIPCAKEKYEALATYQERTKISYSIASLVFRKFSSATYWGWSTPATSKSTNPVSLIPFVGNRHFSILVHRMRYVKNLFVLLYNRSSFSRVSLKSETKGADP